MTSQSNNPPLVPVGGEIILVGHRFEVVGHSVDKNGNAVEVPGKHLGPAPKASKTRRTVQSVAIAPALPIANAPTAECSPPLTPPRPRKARRPRASRGDCRRFQPKPRPIVVVNEPWSARQWLGLIVVLALIVAGIWFSNQGSEARKWERIEDAAKAVERR
jgi:hypothetical protein